MFTACQPTSLPSIRSQSLGLCLGVEHRLVTSSFKTLQPYSKLIAWEIRRGLRNTATTPFKEFWRVVLDTVIVSNEAVQSCFEVGGCFGSLSYGQLILICITSDTPRSSTHRKSPSLQTTACTPSCTVRAPAAFSPVGPAADGQLLAALQRARTAAARWRGPFACSPIPAATARRRTKLLAARNSCARWGVDAAERASVGVFACRRGAMRPKTVCLGIVRWA
jgi:hypothetical protein